MSILDTMKDHNKRPPIEKHKCLFCSSLNVNNGTCNDCGTTNPGVNSRRRRHTNALPGKDRT